MVDLKEIIGEAVCAINVSQQMHELIARDRFLIMLENAPFRFATEDANVVGGVKRDREDRQQKQ